MFKKFFVLSSAASTVLLILNVQAVLSAGQQDTRVEESKRFRASPQALGYLVQVAEVRTGVTSLTFVVGADGYCMPQYQSSVCPVAGKSRLEAIRAAREVDLEPEVAKLQTVADVDDSGFVTDQEGKRFSVLVQFGQQLNYFVTTRRELSADRLAVATRLSSDVLRSQLSEYRDLVARAKKLGVDLVEAPSIR